MADSEEDLTIPRAAMNKMIKEILPSIRVANESRELILNCCTEFIHLISSEANEICNQQTKKTISPEHILQALDQLGFGDFRQAAQEVMEDCKQVAAKRRRQSTRLEHLGIPEDELLRQQEELFARAREEQAKQEQQQWQMMQYAAQMQMTSSNMPGPGGAGPGAGVTYTITNQQVPASSTSSSSGTSSHPHHQIHHSHSVGGAGDEDDDEDEY